MNYEIQFSFGSEISNKIPFNITLAPVNSSASLTLNFGYEKENKNEKQNAHGYSFHFIRLNVTESNNVP